MGHLTAKTSHLALQDKLDRFSVGAPGRETIQKILGLLFTEEEARIAALVPFRFTSVRALAERTGIPAARLQPKLEAMAGKGMLLDLPHKGRARYMLAPTMVGLFEFSMMPPRPPTSSSARFSACRRRSGCC